MPGSTYVKSYNCRDRANERKELIRFNQKGYRGMVGDYQRKANTDTISPGRQRRPKASIFKRVDNVEHGVRRRKKRRLPGNPVDTG